MVVGSFTPVMIVSMAAVIVAVTMAMLVASWKEKRERETIRIRVRLKRECYSYLRLVGWMESKIVAHEGQSVSR